MRTESPCSEQSLAQGEDLLGTAVDGAVHWVGIQVCKAWRKKALADNDLPPAVAAWVLELKARPDCRPVFIKRRGRRGGFTVLYANVVDGRVHRFEPESYEAILDLPWEAIFAGTTQLGRSEERPIFVCTHSARDHCCGLHGAGVARAIEAAAPGRVWQCTHLGGHRFAATLVALPEGVHYGRVRAEEAHDLVSALDRGEVHDPHRLRGQTRYPTPVQAAVDSLRRDGEHSALDAVVATDWRLTEEGARVTVQVDGRTLQLAVTQVAAGFELAKSCGIAASTGRRWNVVPIEPNKEA